MLGQHPIYGIGGYQFIPERDAQDNDDEVNCLRSDDDTYHFGGETFDGSKIVVNGEVDLPILIGHHIFTITF